MPGLFTAYFCARTAAAVPQAHICRQRQFAPVGYSVHRGLSQADIAHYGRHHLAGREFTAVLIAFAMIHNVASPSTIFPFSSQTRSICVPVKCNAEISPPRSPLPEVLQGAANRNYDYVTAVRPVIERGYVRTERSKRCGARFDAAPFAQSIAILHPSS